MSLTNPRIIVVDDNQGIANIVRASLELMGRKPRLIETHTGDDAIDEMRLSTPDLLITSSRLGDTMSGVPLALQAKREIAALPVIVVAAESDPIDDDTMLDDSPFEYLRRPLIPELFIRAIRVALDGPEAAADTAAPLDTMGPVPQVDVDKLRAVGSKLMRDVNAMSFILADRNGKVLTFDGAAGYIDRDLLAAVLGPAFGNVAKIVSIVGNQPRVLNYYDGDKFDIFGLAIGFHHFLGLVFDGASGNRALGPVKNFGGVAVNEMLTIVGESAFKFQQQATIIVPTAKVAEPKGRGKRRMTQEAAAVKAQPPAPAPVIEAPMFEPITNFDPSIFDRFDAIDLSEADALFNPEMMADAAGGLLI